jgi:Zn finger protein HypA/HybF involved in hydrogenase expression
MGNTHKDAIVYEGDTIEEIAFKCKQCDFSWIPRKANSKPKVCPKCQSRDWNKDSDFKMIIHDGKYGFNFLLPFECQKCGLRWSTTGEELKFCPKCKATKRNIKQGFS